MSSSSKHVRAAVRSLPVLTGIVLGLGAGTLQPAAAATTVPGGNIFNEVWTPAGSPYIVQGDITVPAGSFLTIEAGTSVQFAAVDGQASGIDTARIEMTIRGTLTVSGTGAGPVLFTAQSGSGAAIWYGIVVEPTATSANITGAQLQNATQAIRSNAPGTVLSVAATTIERSSNGVVAFAGTPVLTEVTVVGATVGFSFSGAAAGTLQGCVARSNSSHGVSFAGSSGSPALSIQATTLHANGGDGLSVASGSLGTASVAIRNSIVTQNNRGLARSGAAVVTATYNDVWNNLSSNYSGVVAGPGSFSANPLYVAAPTNLRLTSNSPARFAGDAGADIGALPYAGSATPGLYGTLWTHTTLTLAASPHAVGGDLTVAPGVTLTIEPGATLSFASSDIMGSGANTSRAELRVLGALSAAGSAGARIAFTGAASGPGAWYGILMLPGSQPSQVVHATIDEATYGLFVDTSTVSSVTDLEVTGCTTGVYVQSGSPVLSRVTTASCTTGFQFASTGGGDLAGCIARSNSSHGVLFGSTGAALQLSLAGCAIHGNGGDGVHLAAGTAASSLVTVRNSNVTQNARGINRTGSAAVTATYNNVWNNSSGDYASVVPGTGSISANPLYVAPPANLRLTSNSPSRFAGDAQDDLGPLPYAGDPTSGLHGTLWADRTLGAAGSPWAVGGDLTVAPGVTLTVEPGTVLSFANSDIMGSGADTSRAELRVLGRLLARGTAASPIALTGSGAGAGAWYGLAFLPGAAGSEMTHATLEKAVTAISHDTTGTNGFSDVRIDGSTTGLLVTAGAPAFGALSVAGATTGVSFTGDGGGSLVNCIVHSASGDGIRFASTTGGPSLSVTNCTLHGNFTGVRIAASASPAAAVDVRNGNITFNTYGVYREGLPTVSASYNNVFGNVSNYIGLVPGAGSRSADPKYLAAPTDLRLGTGSASIDGATPAGAPARDFDNAFRSIDGDADGSILPDMGAFEYPVFVAAPGAVPEASGGPQPPLTITTPDGGATLDLAWGASCGNDVGDYAVYEGQLGAWYSHQPVTCTTGGQTSRSIVPAAGNRYYLVVPLSATEEGAYGRDSSGAEIPRSASPCRSGQNLGGCR